MSNISWHEVVLSEIVFSRIEQQCMQKIKNDELSSEASIYVLNKLSENDWQRCRKFNGNSDPETFIFSMTNNLIIDFMRSKEGRVRPPKWLKDKGALWVQLWEEICLARKHIEEVVDKICFDNRREPNIVRQTISIIKGKLPWCGVSTNPIESLNEMNDLDRHSDSQNPENHFFSRAFDHGLMIANMIIEGADDSPGSKVQERLRPEELKEVLGKIEISTEERLILKMHFSDGLSFSTIANKLGMPKHQPSRQTKAILKSIRKEIFAIGIQFPEEEIYS